MIRAVRELVLSVVELRAWPQRVDPDLQDLPEGRFVRPVLLPQLVTMPRFEDYDSAEFWMAVVEQMESVPTEPFWVRGRAQELLKARSSEHAEERKHKPLRDAIMRDWEGLNFDDVFTELRSLVGNPSGPGPFSRATRALVSELLYDQLYHEVPMSTLLESRDEVRRSAAERLYDYALYQGENRPEGQLDQRSRESQGSRDVPLDEGFEPGRGDRHGVGERRTFEVASHDPICSAASRAP